MMDPAFARNRIVAWRDEELSIDEARRVRDAIENDPSLTTLVESLAARTAELREGMPSGAPRTLAAEIVARLDSLPPPRRSPHPRVAAALAGVVVLVAVALTRVSDGRIEAAPAAPVASTPPATGEREAEPTAAAVDDPWNGRPPGTAPHLGQRSAARPAAARAWRPRPAGGATDPREPIGAAWEGEDASATPTPSTHLTLRTDQETVLREIASTAGELGGALIDARGKRLAPYPMESGETRTVKLAVPSYNVPLLQERLARLGEIVEGLPLPGPATPGGDVTLSVAIQQR
jgi:hypothetical protein